MKRKILIVIAIVLISIISFIGGTHTNTKDSINLNTVVKIDQTEKGILLYVESGDVYYLKK